VLFEILVALSTGILGIFLGAQIVEGALFVPYWKSLSPKEFFAFYRAYGKGIHQFFAPITIAATLIPLLAVAYRFYTETRCEPAVILMGFFAAAFFSTYFLYFKNANKKLAEASIPQEELPAALNKWGNWHWTRIAFEFIAFTCSLVALLHL